MEFKKKPRSKWKEVLLAIYNGTPTGKAFGRGKKGIRNDHPLAKQLKISGVELDHSLAFLEEQKLIEYDPEGNWIELTEKGFDIAVKVEEQRKTSLYRRSSLFFSGLLVITFSITLVHQMNLFDPRWLYVLYTSAILMVTLLVFLRG